MYISNHAAILAWMKSGMKETIVNDTNSTMATTGDISAMNTTTVMQTNQSECSPVSHKHNSAKSNTNSTESNAQPALQQPDQNFTTQQNNNANVLLSNDGYPDEDRRSINR